VHCRTYYYCTARLLSRFRFKRTSYWQHWSKRWWILWQLVKVGIKDRTDRCAKLFFFVDSFFKWFGDIICKLFFIILSCWASMLLIKPSRVVVDDWKLLYRVNYVGRGILMSIFLMTQKFVIMVRRFERTWVNYIVNVKL